jgi:hypothetical protein
MILSVSVTSAGEAARTDEQRFLQILQDFGITEDAQTRRV